MTATTHLQLPLIAAAQAQKHVTHNDAVLRLDALVQLTVKGRDLTAPPGSPADGDRYIVASGGTGAWEDWDLNVAWYSDGVWTKLVPREGWRVWVADEDLWLVHDGAGWIKPAQHLPPHTVAALPSAAPAGQMIYVTDETGGAVPAFSDGSDWRRVSDRSVVS
jgi:hypothetical protein